MPRKRPDQKRAVDLFCGCGGLTVGLKRAGFQVVSGVELEEQAYSTYKVNHPEVAAYRQDVRTIRGEDLLGEHDEVELLAGCPPCQGFSSLTAKWHRSDPRNQLVSQMARIADELRPKAIMMENVPRLAAQGNRIFGRFVRHLKAAGYEVAWGVLQVADYGVPQSRKRLVLLAGRGFPIALPTPTHSRTGEGKLPKWRSLRSAIGAVRTKPVTFTESWNAGGPQAFNWHVVRTMSIENQRRLAHAVPGRSWSKIPKRLRPKCHQARVTKVGFRNVYGRMSWTAPSSTITGGCTTLSKGRFGHPVQNRTISVREAALIQTFPDDYVFDSEYMDYVCEMIGNALPCDFAEVVARQCMRALRKHEARQPRT